MTSSIDYDRVGKGVVDLVLKYLSFKNNGGALNAFIKGYSSLNGVLMFEREVACTQVPTGLLDTNGINISTYC
ncbi:hypothetical protein HNY73_005209 [Argiope bruennichi]|uniref:Uncharacterized protein n=1 Tax=Argiope bruennichi TaxID=94029 RepID=A0A8T0FI73_ARGBR|nr:hypothetical protein HNY73_005209 [Argiope bruennichi]